MGIDDGQHDQARLLRVRAYVDGFNLYYGAKDAVAAGAPGTSWKWLDVEALCRAKARSAWPGAEIVGVQYFTARVSRRHGNDGAPDRQDAYLRALGQRGVDVVLGRFLQKTKRRPLVSNPKLMVGKRTTRPLRDRVDTPQTMTPRPVSSIRLPRPHTATGTRRPEEG